MKIVFFVILMASMVGIDGKSVNGAAVGAVESTNSVNGDWLDCTCKEYNCSCCQPIDIPQIDVNTTVCLDLKYLVKNIGIEVVLRYGSKIIIDKEISARNPPPVCTGPEVLEHILELCLYFYDLRKVDEHHFNACAKVGLEFISVQPIYDIKLGCVKIPLGYLGRMMQNETKEFNVIIVE